MIEKYGLINRLMRYEDQLYSHPGYYNGALAAIDIYTRIHDHPELTEEKLSKPLLYLGRKPADVQPRKKKPNENEPPKRLKRPNKKPRKQLQQLLTARKKTHQLRTTIPTVQSC